MKKKRMFMAARRIHSDYYLVWFMMTDRQRKRIECETRRQKNPTTDIDVY